MIVFKKRLIESIGKSISNDVTKKQVYLLTRGEVISERDRLEKKYDDGSYDKNDALRMRDLTSYSVKKFNTLLSKLKESEIKPLVERIAHEGNDWIVYSKSGRKLGTHPTEEKALKQLAAIEISKSQR